MEWEDRPDQTPESAGKDRLSRIKELGQRLTDILGKLTGVESTKVPLEEINPQTVAKTIILYLGNPLQEKLGKGRFANPFSIVTVLQNMGHVPWTETDFQKEFPREYLATRKALSELINKGLLETEISEKPDRHQETLYYKVTDEKVLRDFVKENTS